MTRTGQGRRHAGDDVELVAGADVVEQLVTSSSIRARHVVMWRGVKPRLTMRRSSLWPGASIDTSTPIGVGARQALLAGTRSAARAARHAWRRS